VWVAPRRMRKSRTKKMDTAIGNFESALGLSRRRRHSTSAHRPETASVRARTNELRKKRKLSNCCLVGGGGSRLKDPACRRWDESPQRQERLGLEVYISAQTKSPRELGIPPPHPLRLYHEEPKKETVSITLRLIR